MKMNYPILALASALFLSNASYAERSPAGCYIGGELAYQFNQLDATHEQYYCDVQGQGRVIFYNNAEMISGFDLRGTLRADTEELKKYYFDAFHDTDLKHIGQKGYVCVIAPPQIKVKCRSGKGGRLDRLTGQYG